MPCPGCRKGRSHDSRCQQGDVENERAPACALGAVATEPMSRRYRVAFRHADDAIDAVTVWADDSRRAEKIARDWIEQAALQPVSDAESRTEEIGAEPNPGDIGVAESYAAVNHERVAADGNSESTLHRPSLDELRRLTALMRSETGAGWEELRGLLRESDIDPERTAAVTVAIGSRGFPEQVRMVTSDGKVIMFFSGRHPIVRDGLPVLAESGEMRFEQGPVPGSSRCRRRGRFQRSWLHPPSRG
jgi:hypothetical protein